MEDIGQVFEQDYLAFAGWGLRLCRVCGEFGLGLRGRGGLGRRMRGIRVEPRYRGEKDILTSRGASQKCLEFRDKSFVVLIVILWSLKTTGDARVVCQKNVMTLLVGQKIR
jgi:hypothetical protein